MKALGSEKTSSLKNVKDRLEALTKEDMIHPVGDSRVKSDLQSYDLLQNEKYNRLQELKLVLESVR